MEAQDSKSGACDADFFDANNEKAAKLREEVASIALKDMLRWLDDEEDTPSEHGGSGDAAAGGIPNVQSHRSISSMSVGSTQATDRIAIFDATNSTAKRRRWLLEECTSPAKRPGKPTGVVFVESICDDEELLNENFRFKVTNSPDYKDMSEQAAMADLRARVKKYEEVRCGGCCMWLFERTVCLRGCASGKYDSIDFLTFSPFFIFFAFVINSNMRQSPTILCRTSKFSTFPRSYW